MSQYFQKMQTNKKGVLIIAATLVCIFIFFLIHAVFVMDETEDVTFDAEKELQAITAEAPGGIFLSIESAITDIMKKYGLRSGFLLIDEAERQNLITNDQCHALLHYVGHEGYSENPYDYDTLTSLVEGTSCIGGFIHGIEAEIVLTSSNLKEDLWDFCGYAKEKGVSPGPCYHGVGHAASELYDYDIEKALAMCDSLAGGPEEDLSNCYRGIFSQLGNIIVGVDGHTGLPVDSIGVEGLDENNPYLYCEKLKPQYQSSCKSQLLKVMTNGESMEEWLHLCNNPDFDTNSKEICVNISAGVYVRESLSFQETTVLPEIINEFPPEVRKIAILGSLEAFSGYFNDGMDKDWKTFCDKSFKEQDDTTYCTEIFAETITTGSAPWMERSDIR